MSEQMAQLETSGGKPIGTAIPPNDLTLTYESSLILDGERMAYANDFPQWSHAKRSFVPEKYKSAFDGTIAKSYSTPGSLDYGRGYFYALPENPAVRQLDLIPLLMTCRPLDPHAGKFQPDRFVIAGERGMVGKHACLILEQRVETQGTSGQRQTWWVDTDRGYCLLRETLTTTASGKNLLQVTIDHSQESHGEWLPKSWTIVLSNPDGTMRESMRAVVTDVSINVATDDIAFLVDFPAGAMVYDHRSRTEYIVRPDGSERTIAKEEYGPDASYETLVRTDPKLHTLPWWAWLLRVNLVVLVVVVAVFVSRLLWIYLRTNRTRGQRE